VAALEALGREDGLGRRLFMIDVAAFEPLSPALGISPTFAAFVVGDSTQATAAALREFATSLITAGAVYVCAYGPGCTDLETAVDEAGVREEMRLGVERPVIMTTSHPSEPLSEAVEFFLRTAFPDEGYADTCRSAVAITVGDAIPASDVKSAIEQLT